MCAMSFQRLVGGYWGNVLIDRRTGEPAPLPVAHESFHPLQQLSRRWYYTGIEDIEEQVQGRLETFYEEELEDMTKEEEESTREAIKLDIQNKKMDDQQDSDEYAKRILGGIENTIQ
jgi:hypothetical protein